MDFEEFAAAAADIEAESADSAIRDRVVELFDSAGESLSTVTRFLLGRVFPAHESTTLDVGPKLCYEAIARAAGHNVAVEDVEDRLADTGEIGAVAVSYDLGGQRGLAAFGDSDRDGLTVADVDERLRDLAAASGTGSRDRKLDVLFGLFKRADSLEARYVARLVLSEMRMGVGEGTVRDAIADAFECPVEEVERALQVSNDYGEVARVAREEGSDGLSEITLAVGRPVQAMLAQTGTVADALSAWEEVAVETKFDGARVQVHHDGESVALYSRNMEEVTGPLPEIVTAVEEEVDGPAILDGEVVAVDDVGEPLPFQQVLRRFRRKHDVAKARENVSLRLHLFDCLHAEGQDLLDAPLVERHERLASVFGGEEAREVSDLWLCTTAEEIEQLEQEALSAGHEGLMLKNPRAEYTPGKRGKNWLKRKPDVETLDLVVTGAEWGEGRRATLLGSFQLSVRTGEGYETIGKVATGITDEKLEDVTELLEPYIRGENGTAVDIEPAVVFEVGYEEIQPSPTYSSGYALRFPRFLSVRADKDPADADSLDRVESLTEED